MSDAAVHDGRGRSRIDRIPAAAPTLGTGRGRLGAPGSRCAVGGVRAKTGTLTDATALSDTGRTNDGERHVLPRVENASTAAPNEIEVAQDGPAATVNGCRT
jgi:D-alanyl-D-alanine carboxypeptidase/D-alanyl-D-alanine-endopeptidase (penicillin-binding protein 4)